MSRDHQFGSNRSAVAVVAAVGTVLLVLAACGGGGGTSTETVGAVPVALAARDEPAADPMYAGKAITDFGAEWFMTERAASPGENFSISPAGLAVALAMTEPGAVNDGRAELQAVLGIDPADPAAFHASMNALEQSLESRTAIDLPPEVMAEMVEEPSGQAADEFARGTAEMIRVVNAAYLQDDYPFEPDYLDTIARHYGATLNQIDFTNDPDAAAAAIDAWVADRTNDRIPSPLPAHSVTPDTVLVLVSSLYTSAAWYETFVEEETAHADFHLLDGSIIKMPLMSGTADRAFAGDNWVAGTKRLSGDLLFDVLVPDADHFSLVADRASAVFRTYDAEAGRGGALLLPRFEIDIESRPDHALQRMGLSGVFQPGHLRGMAASDRVVLGDIWHHVHLDVDEKGVDAERTGFSDVGGFIGGGRWPDVRADRPFLFRIRDESTGATLFLGQITDPTVGAG